MEAEKLLIAQVYAGATNDEIRGVEQKMSDYMQRVKTYLRTHCPREFPNGTYHECEEGALQCFIAEMKKDVAKFMATLRKVLLAEWTGLSYPQKVNIAVACHMNKAPKPGHEWKDFNPRAWANCGPHQVLSTLPQFQPPVVPKPPLPDIAFDEDGTESVMDEEHSSADNSSYASAAGMKRQASRGGTGVKKAKQELMLSKKKELRKNQVDKLNANMEKLLEESNKNLLSKKQDREMFELATVLDHCKDTKDIAGFLEAKVRARLQLPKMMMAALSTKT